MTYTLNPHTFVCIDRRRTVILDLMQDRYLQIRLEDSNRLAAYIQGWPSVNQVATASGGEPAGVTSGALSGSECEMSGEEGQGLNELVHLGLITVRADPDSSRPQVVLPAPEQELLSAGDTRPARTWRTLFRCYLAGRRARRWLRTRPLHEVVDRVRALRGGSVSSALDVPLARQVVGTFLYLRPYLRSSKDACLLESLSLLNVLSLHGIYAHWVFGVRTEPFFAHCWLQNHDCVLDDSVDRVRQFTPIMIV
jgi:Transglutaminase-like superfamily